MIKLLLLSTLLLTNTYQALASDPKTAASVPLKKNIKYSAETNSIMAWIHIGDMTTTVIKDLATGDFIETAGIVDNHDIITLIPDKNTIEGLKAEIAKHIATMVFS